MTTFTIHTEDKEISNALKVILKALKIKFEISKEKEESPYNPEFVKKILESKQQHDEGEYTTVKKDELKNFLGL
jgi:hypothetical protein